VSRFTTTRLMKQMRLAKVKRGKPVNRTAFDTTFPCAGHTVNQQPRQAPRSSKQLMLTIVLPTNALGTIEAGPNSILEMAQLTPNHIITSAEPVGFRSLSR
jgi:hypothetical protein